MYLNLGVPFNMFNTIEQAIEEIKNGRLIIVVDDEDRENEGDFVTAARNATPETINFMAKHGRGLICAPLAEEICQKFDLDLMVNENTEFHGTAFTVSIDLKGQDCTTGISAHDRAKTVRALIDPKSKAEDFGRPGHIFPLRGKDGGVLRRKGHTEAVIDLARLAGFEPAGVLCEIMNEDGTMARRDDLFKIARQFNLKIITIKDLIKYRLKKESLIERITEVQLPTEQGDFKLIAYKEYPTGEEHLALIKGEWQKDEPVLVRVHSSCVTGDILGSKRCDCGKQLQRAMRMVEDEGRGVILYMKQEGRGIGLMSKLRAYKLQEQGMDTVEANLELGYKIDARDYGIGCQILRDLGITKLKLISNNPSKWKGISDYGLEIVEKVSLIIEPNEHNHHYLKTKKEKMGHEFPFDF